MKQLTFIGIDQVEWRDVPDPRLLSAVEAIVRPLVIGRCDLDVGYLKGLMPMASGEAIGHEVIAEVVEIGEAVRAFKPGDRVVVPAQISCGICRNCRRGFTGRCQSVPFAASYGMGRDGGFGSLAADLARVPFADAMLFPLPKGADPKDWIGFTDMAQDAWRAVGPYLTERPCARVLVIGGLPSVISIYAAGIAVALGAGAVDFYDSDKQRLAEAGKFGATPVDRANAEPEGLYEIVVDSHFDPGSLLEASRFCEPEGIIVGVTAHVEPAAVPLLEMYHKGVTYRTGRPNCRAHMGEVACLCERGVFKPQLISTEMYDFDEADKAWLSSGLRVAASRL